MRARASCLLSPTMTAPTTPTASFTSTSISTFESQDGSGETTNMLTSLETALAALGANSAVPSAAAPTSSSTTSTTTTATSDLGGDPPVADLPELPAEIWALIWPLVAAQIGFVGARRLMGGAICKAAREG